MMSYRSVGSSLERSEARAYLALLSHEPPRTTLVVAL